MSKLKRERGLFDDQERLVELSEMNDPLEKLDEVVDWKIFTPILENAFNKERKSNAGRKPFDRLMMFKLLILGHYYGITHETLEFQIKDRLSFQRFLGLRLSDRVPDANTIWDFKESLTKSGSFDKLFEKLVANLKKSGLLMNKGSMVDASIISAPVQRNSREENTQIKNGEIPKDWNDSKKSQKDTDARWIKKNGKSQFGYKNHIKADIKSKLITECQVTPASMHDSQVLEDLINEDDSHHPLYADSAYASDSIKTQLKKNYIQNRIHKKSNRGRPLTEAEKKTNTNKSKIRARVEHIFGNITMRMKKVEVRSIGLERNTANIILMNITYNLDRMKFLMS